jgi:hypothetical protein
LEISGSGKPAAFRAQRGIGIAQLSRRPGAAGRQSDGNAAAT